MPLEGGKLSFQPGILLEHFDKPIIFDELNRCDIDKVIGPLFTVLSGQSTSLPYLIDPSDPNSERIEIHPKGTPNPPSTYAPTTNWMLIATINSVDKASLYQMSYALTRRFAWIYVDVPNDIDGFISQYFEHIGVETQGETSKSPLAQIWKVVNSIRPIGPAPILDLIKTIRAVNPKHDFFKPIETASEAFVYLDGFNLFIMPMLDGVLREQSEQVSDAMVEILQLSESNASRLRERISRLSL